MSAQQLSIQPVKCPAVGRMQRAGGVGIWQRSRVVPKQSRPGQCARAFETLAEGKGYI